MDGVLFILGFVLLAGPPIFGVCCLVGDNMTKENMTRRERRASEAQPGMSDQDKTTLIAVGAVISFVGLVLMFVGAAPNNFWPTE